MFATFTIRRSQLVEDPDKPGWFNAVTPFGVVSVQPDGRVEFRPAGTHGAYEEFYLSEDGKEAVFPDVAGLTFLVPFRE